MARGYGRQTELIENREALDALLRGDRYAADLGVELVDWGGGWAHVRYRAQEGHKNFSDGLHGGMIFSLADSAFAVACNSWGRVSVALAMEVQFHRASNTGEVLDAESRERSRTRQTTAHGVTVTGEQGRLIASVQALAFRTGRWHLGEQMWSRAWRDAH